MQGEYSMYNYSILFTITVLRNGGAENVMKILINSFHERGIKCEIVVTNQHKSESNTHGLNPEIPVYYIEDEINSQYTFGDKWSIICKLFESVKVQAPDWILKKAFLSVYGDGVNYLNSFIKKKDSVVISFLHPADQITMLAAEGLSNPVIVSERADPIRYFKTRYAQLYLKHYYTKCAKMVFQTPQARDYYPLEVQKIGCIIPNPISTNLPKPYHGERLKIIVNFCRFSSEKNPWLLMDAFDIFAEKHPEYILEFIGEGPLKEKMEEYAQSKKHCHSIFIQPHRQDIHNSIQNYAMFVSSSDYEGMSNSMLESMAIGLPTICTDCPIGGAKYIINDHDNGLLVQVKNPEQMACAMAKIADNPELSEKLSYNGSKIRERLDESAIAQMWMDVLNEVTIG